MKDHKEFMKKVAHETSLPVQAGKYLDESNQTKSDLAAVKRQDALCEKGEVEDGS